MGQILQRYYVSEDNNNRSRDSIVSKSQFPDLNNLPPELALLVLSKLNATDLCLASCVWKNLADDELLWHALCRSQWQHATIYSRRHEQGFSFRRVYLLLDEATLTFNADTHLGLEYLFKHRLVDNTPEELAKFVHYARHIDSDQRTAFLKTRDDVFELVVQLQHYENEFLPNALRQFFSETKPPNERSSYLSMMLDLFSERFCNCNPAQGLSKETVYIICFSLIMLSVDLNSPHVKNKMSKREFIRNTRRAVNGVNDEFAGHLYDNIYVRGHVSPHS